MDASPMAQLIDRRGVLHGITVGAASLASVLAGCTAAPTSRTPGAPPRPSRTPPTNRSALEASSRQPTSASTAGHGTGYPATLPYVPAVAPDIPGTAPLVDDAYLKYPSQPRPMFARPPGSGSVFKVLSFITPAPPTPLDRNQAWQEVNRRLNATIRIDLVSPADYTTRLATLIASGDMPDLWPLFFGLATTPNMATFLQAQAADLTPFLGGESIKDFPNLATIPDYAWRNSGAVIGGKVYLIPIRALSQVGSFTMVHNGGIWDKEIGPEYQPKDADDFKKVLLTLNRPRENRYAISGYPTQPPVLNYCLVPIAQCFGAPRSWRLTPEGSLLKDWETDEFRAAVAYVRELFAAGLFNPDQRTFTVSTAVNEYLAGRNVVSHQVLGYQFKDTVLRGRAANPPTPLYRRVTCCPNHRVRARSCRTPQAIQRSAPRRYAPRTQMGAGLDACWARKRSILRL